MLKRKANKLKLNKSDRVFEINRLKLKIKYYENEEKLSYVKNELKKDLEKLEKGN